MLHTALLPAALLLKMQFFCRTLNGQLQICKPSHSWVTRKGVFMQTYKRDLPKLDQDRTKLNAIDANTLG